MQQQSSTSSKFFQRITIICLSQMMAILGFSVYAYVMKPTEITDQNLSNVLLYVLASFCVVMPLASSFLFKALAGKANAEKTLNGKLTKYMAAMIIRMALLEIPALFAAITVLLTGNVIGYLGSLLMLILFYFYRPSKAQLLQDVTFTQEEKDILNNPDAGIFTTNK
jgi:hypothetical protein